MSKRHGHHLCCRLQDSACFVHLKIVSFALYKHLRHVHKSQSSGDRDLHVFSRDAVLGLVMREPVCPLRMVTVSQSKICSGVAEGVEWMLKTKWYWATR